jgi:hypothetical protein
LRKKQQKNVLLLMTYVANPHSFRRSGTYIHGTYIFSKPMLVNNREIFPLRPLSNQGIAHSVYH